MAERENRTEISSYKRTIKLPPAIGDWTTYRPPKVLAKKVKSGLYGFDRLSQSDLKTALRVHYRFAEQLFKSFKIDLGLGIEFYSISAEQNVYANFLRAVSGPMAYGKVRISEVHEPVILIFDINLANSLINHALGCQDLEILNRPFTEAEVTVLNTAMTEYLKKYSSAFNDVFPPPVFSLIEAAQLAEINPLGSASTFVSFTMDIMVNDNLPGKVIIGYPAKTLKVFVDKYNSRQKLRPINPGRLPATLLNKLKVPVTAILGETVVNSADLHQLEKGDVIQLDTTINSPALVKLNQLVTLLGQPGVQKNRIAARIVGIEEDQELELAPPEINVPEEISPAEEKEEIKVEKEVEEPDLAQRALETEDQEDLADELEKEEDFGQELGDELEDEELEDEDFGEELEEEEKEEE